MSWCCVNLALKFCNFHQPSNVGLRFLLVMHQTVCSCVQPRTTLFQQTWGLCRSSRWSGRHHKQKCWLEALPPQSVCPWSPHPVPSLVAFGTHGSTQLGASLCQFRMLFPNRKAPRNLDDGGSPPAWTLAICEGTLHLNRGCMCVF